MCYKTSGFAPSNAPPCPPSAPPPPESRASAKALKTGGRGPKEARTDWLAGGTRQGRRCGLATTRRNAVTGRSAKNFAAAVAAMATGKGVATPPLWPVEARLAALLPDLLVFRKPRGSEHELATAQGVLLGVHVTGEGEGRCVALPTCRRGGRWATAGRGRGGYGPGPGAS